MHPELVVIQVLIIRERFGTERTKHICFLKIARKTLNPSSLLVFSLGLRGVLVLLPA